MHLRFIYQRVLSKAVGANSTPGCFAHMLSNWSVFMIVKMENSTASSYFIESPILKEMNFSLFWSVKWIVIAGIMVPFLRPSLRFIFWGSHFLLLYIYFHIVLWNSIQQPTVNSRIALLDCSLSVSNGRLRISLRGRNLVCELEEIRPAAQHNQTRKVSQVN